MEGGEVAILVLVLLLLIAASAFLCFRCWRAVGEVIEDEQKPKRQTIVCSMRDGIRRGFRSSMRRVSGLRNSFRRGGRAKRKAPPAHRKVAAVQGLQREISELHPLYLKGTLESSTVDDNIRQGAPSRGLADSSHQSDLDQDMRIDQNARVRPNQPNTIPRRNESRREIADGRLNIDYPAISVIPSENFTCQNTSRDYLDDQQSHPGGKNPSDVSIIYRPHYNKPVVDKRVPIFPPNTQIINSNLDAYSPNQPQPAAEILPSYDNAGYTEIPIGHIRAAQQYGRHERQYGRRGRSNSKLPKTLLRQPDGQQDHFGDGQYNQAFAKVGNPIEHDYQARHQHAFENHGPTHCTEVDWTPEPQSTPRHDHPRGHTFISHDEYLSPIDTQDGISNKPYHRPTHHLRDARHDYDQPTKLPGTYASTDGLSLSEPHLGTDCHQPTTYKPNSPQRHLIQSDQQRHYGRSFAEVKDHYRSHNRLGPNDGLREDKNTFAEQTYI